MVSSIKQRSFFARMALGFFTCGIYPVVYWAKITKDVNKLCEGDGKKTISYVVPWLLILPTLGISCIVWKALLTSRLKNNAARYNLRFSEGAGSSVALSLVFLLAGPFVSQYVIVKNFNELAVAYNEYNGLVDDSVDAFADEVEA